MAETWQKMMKRMKLDNIKSKAPGFFEASGGYTMMVKPYNDRTANALTRCIVDFLQFSGHYANRINTQGQARVSSIQKFDIFNNRMVTVGKSVQWTKSMTRKGTPDIDAVIAGRSAKIEVKVGRDVMSDDQCREQAKIESAGGLYLVATSMPAFLNWYSKVFNIRSASK